MFTVGLIRIFVILPAFLVAVTFLQVYYKFCVAYGMFAVFNFDVIGSPSKIDDSESVRKDKAKVRKMYFQALSFGIIYTIAFYFL